MTVSSERGSERRACIAAQLPAQIWPEQRLLIATVDAETGERRVFERSSGIDLVDAVTASGAVAGIWPPIPFEGHHYIDGGFYSTTMRISLPVAIECWLSRCVPAFLPSVRCR